MLPRVLILEYITDLVPNQAILRKRLEIPETIFLADPNSHVLASIDMLIRAAYLIIAFNWLNK